MIDDLAKILVKEEEINGRVKQLGKEITQHYRDMGVEEIIVVCITNGSILFAADLLRSIGMPVQLDSIRVSSYRDEVTSSLRPEIVDNIRINITHGHVLLIDDILDTGKTLSVLKSLLRARKPASVKVCVLLNKQECHPRSMKADFVGFNIPNQFVVGYGLDFAERYRNLSCIGVLKPELLNPPEWH